MSREFDRLRFIAASPEIHRAALALRGAYYDLLARRSATGCSARELRQAFHEDILNLLAELRLDANGEAAHERTDAGAARRVYSRGAKERAMTEDDSVLNVLPFERPPPRDGGGDRGDGGDPILRAMREGFQRIGEQQAEFVTELTQQVTQLADTASRGDEVIANTLGEAVAKSLEQTAYVAGRLADFMERVVALEVEVARLKAQQPDGAPR